MNRPSLEHVPKEERPEIGPSRIVVWIIFRPTFIGKKERPTHICTMSVPRYVPDVIFHMRERRDNGFEWVRRTTSELFAGKRVLVFGVPAAFSPTCTDHHLPGYEAEHERIRAAGGIQEIWCASVNDAFVMFQWAKQLGIRKVRMLPDGNGDFTRAMGMLVRRSVQGYGERSWRYAAVVDDMRIAELFEEPGKMDDSPMDPYLTSGAEHVLPRLAPLSSSSPSTSSSKQRKQRDARKISR